MQHNIEINLRAGEIRKANADDVPAIENLITDTYTKYVSRMDGVKPGPMRDDYAALVKDEVVYLTDDEYGISSLLVLIDKPDHLLLDNIAVRPNLQGTGLGKRLFIFADEEAHRRGFDELRLYTAEAMYENIALYTRSGWVEYDRFVQKGYPRVFMRRRLQQAA
jgi:GNAT superfamily N-acetyltransferase